MWTVFSARILHRMEKFGSHCPNVWCDQLTSLGLCHYQPWLFTELHVWSWQQALRDATIERNITPFERT